MSELIAIAYADEAAVDRATANVAEAVEKGLLEVEDLDGASRSEHDQAATPAWVTRHGRLPASNAR